MFGKKLRELRVNDELTQQELASILKVSASTIGMYEQGRRSPDTGTLNQVAEYFNVSIDWLLGRTDVSSGDTDNFKIRLKQLRKEQSITQQELADKIGIVRTAITNYETGRTIPDSETLSLIAKIFNTTTDYLLGNSDIKNPYKDYKEESPAPENPTLKQIEGLSDESKKELEKYIQLLKIKDSIDKSKDETSSALEKEA